MTNMTTQDTHKTIPAYDADYSHLKPDYRQSNCKTIHTVEPELIDYDISSDAQWMDDYDELRA